MNRIATAALVAAGFGDALYRLVVDADNDITSFQTFAEGIAVVRDFNHNQARRYRGVDAVFLAKRFVEWLHGDSLEEACSWFSRLGSGCGRLSATRDKDFRGKPLKGRVQFKMIRLAGFRIEA